MPLLRTGKSVSNAAGAEVSNAVCGGAVWWCRQVTDSAQLAERFPDLDLATAYRAQQAFVQSKIGVHRMIK